MKITFSMMYQGLLLVTSGLFTGIVVANPVPPDAGQILQQLQSAPLPVPAPASMPPLDVQETPPNLAAPDHEARFLVKQIHVEGSTVYSATELESLLVSLRDTEQSMTDLNNAARILTSFYRHHGYPVARAYLPAQTISNGEVTIKILEGRLDKVVLKNQSRVSSERIEALVNAHIPQGQVLTASNINQTLLLLDTWGDLKSHVRGTLQAGDSVGTSNLIVNVPAGKHYEGDVILDNYGTRFTGQDRLSGHLLVYSPLNRGDRLDLRASVSNEDLAYGYAVWTTPVGNNGLVLGANASYNRYVLGDAFASLDVHGTAQTVGVQGGYPLKVDVKNRILSVFALRQKQLHDVIGTLQSDSKKTIKSVDLQISGEHAANAQVSAWQITATAGQLDISTPNVLSVDQASAKTNGNFAKIVISANSLLSFSPKVSAYFALNTQRASKNLESSEKFALGGVNAVRAYPSGEGTGDQGWQGTVELRYNLLPFLQCVAFYDAGGIDINHSAFIANAKNSRHLSGEGVGLNANIEQNFALKFSVAWHGGEEPRSDKDQKPRVWAQGVYKF